MVDVIERWWLAKPTRIVDCDCQTLHRCRLWSSATRYPLSIVYGRPTASERSSLMLWRQERYERVPTFPESCSLCWDSIWACSWSDHPCPGRVPWVTERPMPSWSAWGRKVAWSNDRFTSLVILGFDQSSAKCGDAFGWPASITTIVIHTVDIFEYPTRVGTAFDHPLIPKHVTWCDCKYFGEAANDARVFACVAWRSLHSGRAFLLVFCHLTWHPDAVVLRCWTGLWPWIELSTRQVWRLGRWIAAIIVGVPQRQRSRFTG